MQNIRKKIRLEVSNKFDKRFLENNLESDQVREILDNHERGLDIINELSNAS